MAFNRRRRVYPDAYASMVDPMDTISPASYRLRSAEEGYIGIRPGPLDPGQDSIIGDPPGGRPSGHPPLHHYATAMDREAYVPDNPNPGWLATREPLPDPVYHDDGRFDYDGIPYRRGTNWYGPSARGPDAHYGRYHPPPFASRPYMNMYANDNPTIHRPPGSMGRGPYTNTQFPLRGQPMAGYAEPSSGQDVVLGAYREARDYHAMSPDTATPPGVEGGTRYSADIPDTHPDDIAQPFEPPPHDANIATVATS